MEIQFMKKRYNTSDLLKKRRNITKSILSGTSTFVEKKILMLSGSTIGELADQLNMFCMSRGIKLNIVQGDYGRYYEDALYNDNILNCKYDYVYIHISNRNIQNLPVPFEDRESIERKLELEKNKLNQIFNSLRNKCNCPIICNNFELFSYRVMGNRESWDLSGINNFVMRLNMHLGTLAENDVAFYINDINYLSAYYGIKEWSQPSYWYRYKYAMCLDAIPLVAQNLSAIIFSLSGLNKKCVVLDLDNTLWGGIIGDDGMENIIIGNDSAQGEAYVAFQDYIKRIKQTGIILSIASKNNEKLALQAFDRKEMVIKISDISSSRINWEAKSFNIQSIAQELNIGMDSFVFIDDNAMERDEVTGVLPMVNVPSMSKPENYINDIEEYHLFEVTSHTREDDARTQYYLQNKMREEEKMRHADYDEYLESLKMKWNFSEFKGSTLERITQLINKTNQFNLTTKRMNLTDVEMRKNNKDEYICIQGSMSDKFGDNGLVTVLIGKINCKELFIEEWLMSCRVFRRNGEFLLFEHLLGVCENKGIEIIRGKYIPTQKNSLVKEFYSSLGFEKTGDEDGITYWCYDCNKK